MNKKLKKLIIISVAVVIAVSGTVGGVAIYQQQKTAGTELNVTPVQNLATQYWPDGTSSSGLVTSDFVQEIFPETEKNISKVFVKLGDKVKKGDPLVEYDRVKLELESQAADINLQKLDLTIDTAEKELYKLENTTPQNPPVEPSFNPDPGPGVDPEPSTGPDPTIPTPTPTPPSKAFLHSVLDLNAKPYMGSGTTEDPYVFLCTEDCVVTSEFLGRVLGVSKPTPTPSPSPSISPSPIPSEEPQPTDTPVEPTEGPVPSQEPSDTPEPTDEPTQEPTDAPTQEPTQEPTDEPSQEPTDEPEESSSQEPSAVDFAAAFGSYEPVVRGMAVIGPSTAPTATPTMGPTPGQSPTPSIEPTASVEPSETAGPSPSPTILPAPGEGLPPGNEPFAARLEVREGNTEYGTLRYGWFMDGTKFDGALIPPEPSGDIGDNGGTDNPGLGMAMLSDEDGFAIPGADAGTGDSPGTGDTPGTGDIGYTADELKSLIRQKKQEVADLYLQKKQANMDYNKAKRDLDNATVKSVIDGEVRTLTDLDTAITEGKAFLSVSGGTGMYFTGTVSEAMLGQVKVGDDIVANSWETGASYTGKIVNISDYPVTGGYSSSQNPNNSDYQFTAYIAEPGDLYNGAWLDTTIGTGQTDNGLYLDAAYIRKDDGGNYVLKSGKDNRIEKQYINTGKSIYGNRFFEILSGITGEDKIAFPYGKTAIIGAKAKEGDEFAK